MALGSTITQVTDSGLKPGITFPNFVSTGIATATNFKTGTTDVHSTGITVATSVVGSAVTSNSTGIDLTGIVTATTFKGALTGNVTGNASGTAGGLTGSPNITIGTLNASTGTFSSNVTISGNLGVAGTVTYEDVARVDATGISTFREGFGVGPLAGIALTAYKDGSIRTSGIVTALSFGSDTNSIFTTGGTERLRITASGNVGITESSPQRALHIGAGGVIRFERGDGTRYGELWNDNSFVELKASTDPIRLNSQSYLRFDIADSEKMRLTSAGDLLIGNTTSSNETGKLDIYHAADDDINNPHIRLWGAGNNDARIEFGSPTNVGEGGYISYNDADEGLYIGSRMGAYSEVNLCTGMNDGSPHTKIRLSVKADGRVMTEVQNGRGGIGMVGAFMARVAAVYDFAAGTRKIVMTNEEFDANGWYDASNSRYTPLCKGWYQMHFHLQFKTGLNNNSVEMQLYPYFNGAALPGPVQGWDNNHGNYAYNSWSTMIYFDGVDDYVEFYGNCSHTTDVNTATRMMGYLVHPLA